MTSDSSCRITECHGVGVGDALAVPRAEAETAEQHHARIFREREVYTPSQAARAATVAYRETYGIPEPDFGPAGLRSKRACLYRAHRLAAEYLAQPHDPDNKTCHRAYDALIQQTINQAVFIRQVGVNIIYLTDEEIKDRGLDPEGLNPYPTAEAQARDIDDGRLMIASLAPYPHAYHPILSVEEYDLFRAVHDFFGHAAVGTGFDRHGEYQAWLHHVSMFFGPAILAASSELHLENSTLVATGTPAPHHCVVFTDERSEWVNPFTPDGRYKGADWLHISE